MIEPLAALLDAARSPLAEWRARYPGRRAIGVQCSYVPAEMIHAAGFVPVRLRATSGQSGWGRVDAHLQSFVCALCRSTLDQFLNGDLACLDGVVFAHSCDAMQALADVWRANAAPGYRLEVVMQPTRLGEGSPAARAYLVAELGRFRERLAAWAGRPVADGDVRAGIALYDETRRLVQALQARRGRLTAAEFVAVLDAAQRMPLDVLNPLLSALVPALDERADRGAGPRLYLAGAVLDEPRLLELIDDAGARIVGDDLCSGSRHLSEQVGVADEPLGALADYYLRRAPCPAKYRPDHDAGAHLLRQVRQAGADGVVFVLAKFCDPHAFERALALPALERAGVPHLLLEMEQTPSLEALRTRLQAFVEIL